MPDKIGWGILGTGMIAKALAKALAESQTSELLAVGSRTRESAEKFGDEFKVPKRYDSYDAVLADPDVRAVYISLPNHLHAEWAIRCAEAGKAILLEKPFATNYAESMAIVEAARHHGVFLLEAFMYRCHPQTARLARLVRERAIGDVRMIQAHFSYNMGPNLANIRLQNEAAGGGIMDVGCYCMSMARLIAGNARGHDFAEPTQIKGIAHIGQASRVDEWATAAVSFPGDILANLTCGNQVGLDSTLRIWGSEGSILVPNPWFPGREGRDARIIVQRAGQEKPEEIEVPSEVGLYTIEVDVTANTLDKSEAPPPCMTWADSLGNMRALDAWRSQVGLIFDREKTEALKPVSGRPLARRPKHNMEYGRVEGVDKPVARVVMGSMVINTGAMPYSYALLDHYYEIGGNAIDTAWVYGGGESEKAVGRWIKGRGLRDEIFLIGKGAATTQATPQLVTQQLLQSLDRFGLDGVDLYMMHRDNVNVPVGEFVDVLNEHRAAGRLRAFGGSNWTTARLQEANEYARAKGVPGFAASSPNVSLAAWNEPMWDACISASDADSRRWYAESGVAVFAWSSQASGFFTGRFGPEDRDNPALRDIVRVWFNEGNFERMRRAQDMAQRKGVTGIQIALGYVLRQPMNMFALIGPQSIEETRTSVEALDVQLSPEELRWLNLETGD